MKLWCHHVLLLTLLYHNASHSIFACWFLSFADVCMLCGLVSRLCKTLRPDESLVMIHQISWCLILASLFCEGAYGQNSTFCFRLLHSCTSNHLAIYLCSLVVVLLILNVSSAIIANETLFVDGGQMTQFSTSNPSRSEFNTTHRKCSIFHGNKQSLASAAIDADLSSFYSRLDRSSQALE